jgi:hypothetical protein
VVPLALTVLVCLRFQRSEWSDDCLGSMRMALNLATHGTPSFNLGEPAAAPWSLLWVGPMASLCLLGLSPFTAAALLTCGLVAAAYGLFWQSHLASHYPTGPGGAHRSRLLLAGGAAVVAAAIAWTWFGRTHAPAAAPRAAAVMRELHNLDARRWSTDFGRPEGRRLAVISREPGYDGLRLGPAQMVLPWRALGDPHITGTDPYRPLEIAGAAETDGRAELNQAGRSWRTATAAAGFLELQLRFDRERIGLAEPIASLGDPATGLMCMVRRDADDALRFLVRENGSVRSSRVATRVDFERVHRWVLAWAPSGSGSGETGRIRLWLDGSLLGDWNLPVRRYRDDEVLIGWNTQGYGACLSRFGGTIAGIGGTSDDSRGRAGPLDNEPQFGPGRLLQARVRLLEPLGRNEPVVATGSSAEGNVVFVRRVAPGRVVFGAAATGAPVAEGRPIEVDDGAEHTVELALGPWFAEGPPRLTADQIRVTLDGRLALMASQPFRPFNSRQVWVLQNPFAVAGCDLDFTGSVLSVGTVDAAARARATQARLATGMGPITALLQFNGPTLGVGLGLLETGVTGAGDIVSLVMLDPTHARFSFDHWGVGGFTGPVVPIDPQHVYRCRIELGSLQPPDPGHPERATDVRVELDDRTVLSGRSAFHPAKPDQLHFMANALGSSGVSAPFDGTCVSVARGRND